VIYFLEAKISRISTKQSRHCEILPKRTYTIDNQMLNASLDMAIARTVSTSRGILLRLDTYITHPLETTAQKKYHT
jgi:hypothetical protein